MGGCDADCFSQCGGLALAVLDKRSEVLFIEGLFRSRRVLLYFKACSGLLSMGTLLLVLLIKRYSYLHGFEERFGIPLPPPPPPPLA